MKKMELNLLICEDTNDKLYLLSLKDVTNTSYGFNSTTEESETREALTTDYARSKHCFIFYK